MQRFKQQIYLFWLCWIDASRFSGDRVDEKVRVVIAQNRHCPNTAREVRCGLSGMAAKRVTVAAVISGRGEEEGSKGLDIDDSP